MSDLRETIVGFTDEKLFEMYAERGEYTEEAVSILMEEAKRRGLDLSAREEKDARFDNAVKTAQLAAANLKHEDFAPLAHPFSKIDMLIANAILQDSKIPYIIDKCENETALNTALAKGGETQAGVQNAAFPLFVFLAYKGSLDQARELIEEHFTQGENGCYVPRESDIIARLKAFSFSDVKFTEKAAVERLDVDFENSEKTALLKLAQILLNEVDTIEERDGRVVFFCDALEDLAEKLKKDGGFTRTDFLAIIEMCQIYCEDPRYDTALNHVAENILDFLLN